MSAPTYLRSTMYSGISNRGANEAEVEKALNEIINSGPTQIQPDDREGFLNALLEDLEPNGSVWQAWPEDLFLLALTAIRILGRNQMGSTTLLSAPHLGTLLYHSGLPLPIDTFPVGAVDQRPTFDRPTAGETLKILANLLLLHPAGRNRFFKAGGADAIALAVSGRDASGQQVEDVGDISAERVFLLSRIGFLVTLERKEAVEAMVDQHSSVDALALHLYTRPSTPPNFLALSELFKLAANLIRFYPHIPGTESPGEEGWDDRLGPLLPATLHHFHLLPYTDLSPPLSNAIQVLLFIPFLPSHASLWTSVPTSPSPSSPKRSPSPVKQLLSKIGESISTNLPHRKSSTEASAPGGLAPPRTPSPLSRRHSSDSGPSAPAGGIRHDPEALPKRLMAIFDDYCTAHLPAGTRVDDERRDGVVFDEVLPPLLLVMMKCAAGSAEMRSWLKDRLLPSGLDRSPAAGPLESRPGTLGNLLRLMTSSNHPACRDSAGELMWALCNGDAATLSTEIGYGNSAGLLFRKGLSGPPPARIEELADEGPAERHPITALSRTADDQSNPALDAMPPEEKEREAERLFVLFDRLEKSKIISAQTDTSGGGGNGSSGGRGTSESGPRGIKEVLEDKLRSGEYEERDREREAEEERKRLEEEDKEEEEALRDLREYKARQAKRQ